MSLGVYPNTQNRNLYLDVAEWVRDYAHLSPVGLMVSNPSSTIAEHVVVTIQIDAADGLTVLDLDDKRPFPAAEWNMPHIPVTRRYTGGVDAAKFGSRYEIRAELGNVQPGTAAWSSDSFYIGARLPSTVKADVTISANNLRTPMTMKAEFEIQVALKPLTISEITALHPEENSVRTHASALRRALDVVEHASRCVQALTIDRLFLSAMDTMVRYWPSSAISVSEQFVQSGGSARITPRNHMAPTIREG